MVGLALHRAVPFVLTVVERPSLFQHLHVLHLLVVRRRHKADVLVLALLRPRALGRRRRLVVVRRRHPGAIGLLRLKINYVNSKKVILDYKKKFVEKRKTKIIQNTNILAKILQPPSV